MTDDELQTYVADVRQELDEMRRVGIPVPARTYTLLEDRDRMRDMTLRVSECADLLIQLAAVEREEEAGS